MEPKLLKIDRNGSKHWQGEITCDRCGGAGYYAIAICNGAPVLSPLDGGVCWKCGGTGKVLGKWIERTPEYQAKLDARREAKRKAKAEEDAKKRAEWERKQAEAEAKRKAEQAEREAKIKAEKAISQYVGETGKRMTVQATYIGSASFEVKSFTGYGTDTMHIHMFKDADGNKLIWKTATALGTWLENGEWLHHEEGELVQVTGTVKEHKEYRDEKQTALTRCKLEWKGA
jgi:hypothetical protein